ncbi:cadherin repeat domain-containing protein [Photobacterium sp. SDRW27]|uniref:cadherin repeat domain-containing protein n=1 Tax=Photobacterium obscurum TaxID=2829490 RepID=UPI002244E0D3|nr:cadherin repeat domain-containing protein [Photobacterium obscurum]MCW8328491.1 cadherin repeat domain-containing protein [Photobacterium obscurum]
MKYLFATLLIGIMLSISGCGGGGDSSPSDTTLQPFKNEKVYREPLKANDIDIEYSNLAKSHSSVLNVYGTLSYRLADGEAKDIVSVEQYTGLLTILNPGDVRIIVEDTSPTYQSSSATFTVHVGKGTNYNLSASRTTISALDTDAKNLSYYVRGNQGSLTFELAPESSNLLAINSQTGEFIHYGIPGTARVIVTDNGNRRYQPKSVEFEVVIKAVNPDILGYDDLSRDYSEHMTLSPKQISGDDMGTFSFKLAESSKDSDVLAVDAHTGYMTIHKTGCVVIEVTNELGSGYTDDERKAYFKVEILKADRPNLTVSSSNFVYQPNHIIQPAINNMKGQVTYRVESGDNVIAIDSNTHLPKIIGVGAATLIANDDGNGNYKPSSARFTYDVQKASRPKLVELTINRTFSGKEQLQTVTPVMKGQKGQLTFRGSSDVVSVHGEQLTIEHAGLATLTATDDGGLYYLPSSATLKINVAKGEHPEFEVKDIAAEYSPNLCIPVADANISGNKGTLSLSPQADSDKAIATYNTDRECFKVHKHGTAKFDVISLESHDFLKSAPHEMSLVIAAADSTLFVDKGVNAVFSGGQPTISPPTVHGKKGELSYRLSPETRHPDVVEVDSHTGEMTILNVGTTTVEVSDSGGDGYKPAITTFSVRITQADNPLSVTYPEASYQRDQAIMPSVENGEGEINYYLGYSPYDVVGMVSANTGQLEIHSAGEYKVKVVAKSSRNYKSKVLIAEGKVNKAKHPGIVTELEAFEYVPMKQVTLDLPSALGKRSFTVRNTHAGVDKRKYVSMNPNNGETTLLNYDRYGDEALLNIFITEEESRNHLALDSSFTPTKQIKIVPPKAGKSTKDIELDPTFTIVDSSLNGNARYTGLYSTRMNFAGVAGVKAPTDEERAKYGEGMNLFLLMKQVGTEQVFNHNIIRVYAQRYVGCQDDVNDLTLDKVAPVAMDSLNFCVVTTNNRFMKYTIIDDTRLGKGDWEAAVPFVAYLSSDRPFLPNDEGGYYTSESEHSNGDGSVKMIEWNRINLKLSK